MLFREIIVVYSENHTKSMQSCWLSERVVHMFTALFEGVKPTEIYYLCLPEYVIYTLMYCGIVYSSS
jgi:hypothetical protein